MKIQTGIYLTLIMKSIKSGLISKRSLLWLKYPNKKIPNHYPKHLFFRWIVLRIVIWHLSFGDLSQSAKFSQINPPLTLELNIKSSVLELLILSLIYCIRHFSQRFKNQVTLRAQLRVWLCATPNFKRGGESCEEKKLRK